MEVAIFVLYSFGIVLHVYLFLLLFLDCVLFNPASLLFLPEIENNGIIVSGLTLRDRSELNFVFKRRDKTFNAVSVAAIRIYFHLICVILLIISLFSLKIPQMISHTVTCLPILILRDKLPSKLLISCRVIYFLDLLAKVLILLVDFLSFHF